MVEQVHGDMFSVGADILVNTVNCVGVMGCGVALAFKKRYPHMFKEYRTRCLRNQIKPGEMWCCEVEDGITVVNFPTKLHWKNPSKYEYVRTGLVALRSFLETVPPGSKIALPALGCGHGGLDWTEVLSEIQSHLGNLDHIDIFVFHPSDSRKVGRP